MEFKIHREDEKIGSERLVQIIKIMRSFPDLVFLKNRRLKVVFYLVKYIVIGKKLFKDTRRFYLPHTGEILNKKILTIRLK